ncbi:MAG: Rrf2 family transcriptional regulator [Microthrixaceae bacterium]|nr:Rrf2 family transcriptional regulator [Microthrixaceae bacterium]
MRLEVTRKSDLATKALLELDALGRRSKAAELATLVGTTPGFLSQVLTPLVANGWVRSEPGPTGGYSVATDLANVSVLNVIEAVEGPTDSGRCSLEDKGCSDDNPCVIHDAWSRARRQLLDDLGRIPLSKLGTEALSKAISVSPALD